jgi:hypothetical protein
MDNANLIVSQSSLLMSTVLSNIGHGGAMVVIGSDFSENRYG